MPVIYMAQDIYIYMNKYRDRYMKEFKAKAPLHRLQDQPDRSSKKPHMVYNSRVCKENAI